MDLLQYAEDVTANRHGGNPCSSDAFERVKPTLPEQRAEVLRLIEAAGQDGLTAKEIAARLGTRLNCISGRCSELVRDGLAWRPGRRRDGSAVLVAGRP